MQIHLGMDIRQINCPERHKGHSGVFRGSNIQKSGEAVKRLDQLLFTSADSSGNGQRLNTSHPSIPQEACREGGLGGHTFKSLGKLSNGWTDWHQIRYTSVDSSGNGHRLKQLAPRYPRVAFLVVLWDQQFKRLGNCGQTAGRIGNQFCTYNAYESGNGQQFSEQIGPMRHQGEHFGVVLSRGNFWGFRGG